MPGERFLRHAFAPSPAVVAGTQRDREKPQVAQTVSQNEVPAPNILDEHALKGLKSLQAGSNLLSVFLLQTHEFESQSAHGQSLRRSARKILRHGWNRDLF